MKSFYSLVFSALLVIPMWSIASESGAQKEAAKWSYEGATGPSHWGDLSAEYSTCKQGKNQSPIDISVLNKTNSAPIKFDYGLLVAEDIINNGHTIQVNVRSGGSIKLDDKEFFLKQFHFHSPSENMVNSSLYPLEAHFVHVSEDNELAVVALLYQPGQPNIALQAIIKNFPLKAGESKRLGAKDMQGFERTHDIKNYVRFNGSLTTPPCTEGVRWIVMRSMPSMSRQQLNMFQKELKHPNNRPVQPLNARIVIAPNAPK